MDSFRGSIPPNFISFCLENQTTEVANAPARPATTTSAANPPTEAGPQIQNPSVSQSCLEDELMISPLLTVLTVTQM